MTCIRDAILILEKVLAGDMSADDALIEWSDIDDESNEIMIGAWHELTHYAADADIRAKDTEYAEYQREQLKTYASRLSSQLKNP